ncbi:four helix bundle protein [Bacteroidales bacterium OttesenSCG-928-B11]|nr:four helix bundle protein [Bacteroidales bacterium OttesenSCG-928-B11]
MATIKRFEDLEAWNLAREFAKFIFGITCTDLFEKDYRFKSQIRASSGSVMDNIAEGFERGGNKEFVQFLFYAKGSCGETRSQLYRALDCNYISKEVFDLGQEKAISLSKSIGGFIKYLQNTEIKGSKYK